MRGTARTASWSRSPNASSEDGATISFGVNPPFLWQHITGHYTNISVTTAGDRVQDANGNDGRRDRSRTCGCRIPPIPRAPSDRSTRRSAWKSAGIKDTVAANLPGVGNLITGVRTDPAAGTIIVDAGDNSVTAKPVVTDGDLNLEVLDVNGPLPKDGCSRR